MTTRDRLKTPGDNAAYRMLAKYKLMNDDGKFWDQGFRPIDREALLPTDDPFARRLAAMITVGPRA